VVGRDGIRVRDVERCRGGNVDVGVVDVISRISGHREINSTRVYVGQPCQCRRLLLIRCGVDVLAGVGTSLSRPSIPPSLHPSTLEIRPTLTGQKEARVSRNLGRQLPLLLVTTHPVHLAALSVILFMRSSLSHKVRRHFLQSIP
jgi:hypothetical protein